MKKIGLLLAVCLLVFSAMPVCSLGEPYTLRFDNKVANWADNPWVILHGNVYYYCWAGKEGVCVARFRNLPDLGYGLENLPYNEVVQARIVWMPDEKEEYSQHLSAPELHFLDGRWYIYVSADDGEEANRRMLCLEGKSDDPLDGFTVKSVLRAKTDRWATDGTVLKLKKNLYFIWSGWDGKKAGAQNLYIAKMKNPWTISGERELICEPEFSWEKKGGKINEAPELLVLGKQVHLTYSASISTSDDCVLGMLSLTGSDPMKKDSWIKSTAPVFWKVEKAYGPSHACFTTSPDGETLFMVFQANEKFNAGKKGRRLWVQKYTVSAKNYPIFGKPYPAGTFQTVPVNWQ